MKRFYIAIMVVAVSLFAAPRLSAQDFGGVNFNNEILTWSDVHNLSFTAHNYGTARSMGMGNAFTALGADLTSAMLNPAGIGMYVESDISISAIGQFTKSKTAGSEPYYEKGTAKWQQDFYDHTERLGLSSVGGVFTAYRSTGALTNLNVGVVYNRIADFNYSTLGASRNQHAVNSMANFFCTLSNVDGLQTKADGKMDFGNPYFDGATLAYYNGLTNKDGEGWFIDRIGGDALVDQFSSIDVRGSLGEYDFSVGMNFADIVYVGATVGIQSLNYKRSVFYGENYLYPNGYPSYQDMPNQLDYMNYVQRTQLSGTGINFKVGVTVRPVHWWRVGVAYHTPTYMNTTLVYGSDMWSDTYSAGDKLTYVNEASPRLENSGKNSWDYTSPSRLLFGTAFTLGGRVIVSADYEHSWYQSVALHNAPRYLDNFKYNLDYKGISKEIFQGGSTVRAGVEGYVLPFLALRAGYIWSGNTLREGWEDLIAGHQIPTRQEFITAGVGIKFNQMVYLDLAYQYSTTNYTKHQTFYYVDPVDAKFDFGSKVFQDNVTRHIAVVTLGLRF